MTQNRGIGRGIPVKPNCTNMSINILLQLQMGDKFRNKMGHFTAMVYIPLVPLVALWSLYINVKWEWPLPE